MTHSVLKLAALSAVLLAPATYAQLVSCTRAGLKAATDLYIAAQVKGDTSGLPPPARNRLGYWRNARPVANPQGIRKKPMKIDFSRSLLHTSSCQTFAEVIVTDKAAGCVLGTRVRINHGRSAEIEIIWT